MSRIGKKEITIPASVKVTYEKGVVSVSGPKGNLSHEIRPEIGVQISGDNLTTV
ncbi:MAG TPA: 50S ribosomal protein L6, partial [bacterium]|nr:50S ribosomal protein L6 [bacterium]